MARVRIIRAGRAPRKGRGKYGAIKTTVDGITFDSKKEAARYVQLRNMQAVGKIEDLQMQVRYRLEVNGLKIADYIADFVYFDTTKARPIVEDVKGVRTAVYRIKKKLMEALHGIEILET
jgi:hypothetical protein